MSARRGQPSPKWSLAERAAWPDGHKRCRGCDQILPYERFTPRPTGLGGREARCKPCRSKGPGSVYLTLLSRGSNHVLWSRARGRARDRGVEFTITGDDIVVPERCPVFDVPLEVNHPDWAPSLDRVDNRLGYVPGNVRVISRRANAIKRDATASELAAVLRYMTAS